MYRLSLIHILTRFFAGDPNGGLFVTGGYAVYMFGFPAVALAMTLLAKPENRKAVAGVLGSAALTAICLLYTSRCV